MSTETTDQATFDKATQAMLNEQKPRKYAVMFSTGNRPELQVARTFDRPDSAKEYAHQMNTIEHPAESKVADHGVYRIYAEVAL